MERKFTTTIGAPGNRSSSALGSRSAQTRSRNRWVFLASHGYRRGHGRSSQPLHGNDLAELVNHLSLEKAIYIGHSTCGGEVARYIDRHGTKNVAKAIPIGAMPPARRSRYSTNCAARCWQTANDLSLPFYGHNKPDTEVSESFWRQGMMAGFPASHFCIKAFSETDRRKIRRSSTSRRSSCTATPARSSPSAPRLCCRQARQVRHLEGLRGRAAWHVQTLKDRVNAELLAFIKS
jgi:non-heme chloroperoxidase